MADKKPKPDIDTAPSFEVDPDRLNDHFAKVASELASLTGNFAKALGRQLRAEAARKRLFAELFLEFKSTLLENGKSPSEEVAKQKVILDPRYQDAIEMEIDAEVSRARWWGLCDAMRTKRDAIVSLGAQVRSELEGEPSLRRRDDD